MVSPTSGERGDDTFLPSGRVRCIVQAVSGGFPLVYVVLTCFTYVSNSPLLFYKFVRRSYKPPQLGSPPGIQVVGWYVTSTSSPHTPSRVVRNCPSPGSDGSRSAHGGRTCPPVGLCPLRHRQSNGIRNGHRRSTHGCARHRISGYPSHSFAPARVTYVCPHKAGKTIVTALCFFRGCLGRSGSGVNTSNLIT